MFTAYDEYVLQSMADGLYGQARQIVTECVVRYTFGALILSVACVIGFGKLFPTADSSGLDFFVISVLVIAGIAWGLSVGRARAFDLKVKAQQILCQMQIERNTRRVMSAVAS